MRSAVHSCTLYAPCSAALSRSPLPRRRYEASSLRSSPTQTLNLASSTSALGQPLTPLPLPSPPFPLLPPPPSPLPPPFSWALAFRPPSSRLCPPPPQPLVLGTLRCWLPPHFSRTLAMSSPSSSLRRSSPGPKSRGPTARGSCTASVERTRTQVSHAHVPRSATHRGLPLGKQPGFLCGLPKSTGLHSGPLALSKALVNGLLNPECRLMASLPWRRGASMAECACPGSGYLCGAPCPSSLAPCLAAAPPPWPISNGYLVVTANGGLNQMRAAVRPRHPATDSPPFQASGPSVCS